MECLMPGSLHHISMAMYSASGAGCLVSQQSIVFITVSKSAHVITQTQSGCLSAFLVRYPLLSIRVSWHTVRVPAASESTMEWTSVCWEQDLWCKDWYPWHDHISWLHSKATTEKLSILLGMMCLKIQAVGYGVKQNKMQQLCRYGPGQCLDQRSPGNAVHQPVHRNRRKGDINITNKNIKLEIALL